MKIKALLATLIAAVGLNGVSAGEWCPKAPVEDKCPVECCPSTGGSLSFGYDSDYVWKGIRFARDFVWTDVNYTFDSLGLPIAPTVGVWHGTDLSNVVGYGDETNIYAGFDLPSMMGVDASLLYTYYLFPTTRGPANGAGDSFSSIGLHLGKEMMGISLAFGSEYYFGAENPAGGVAHGTDLSAWYHYLEAGKSIDITDCLALDLSAGLAYVDGLYSQITNVPGGGDSGWGHYYIKAGVDFAIAPCATLSPYIAYNGTPDGWKGDGAGPANFGANHNDVFYWGISLGVEF